MLLSLITGAGIKRETIAFEKDHWDVRYTHGTATKIMPIAATGDFIVGIALLVLGVMGAHAHFMPSQVSFILAGAGGLYFVSTLLAVCIECCKARPSVSQ